jgi:integrase
VSVKAFIRWLWQIEAIPSLPRVLDGKSDVLNISPTNPAAVIFTTKEIEQALMQARARTKLFVLLMLNCGMTQKDIADLLKSEINWEQGRIVWKRSKTADSRNVPTVSYILWPETLRLLELYQDSGDSELALLNSNGAPLWAESYDDKGKYRKTDNIKNAFDRLKAKLSISKPLKSFKKSSASRLRDDERYNGVEDLFLGHATQKMSDKHYTTPPQRLLDSAICWLATEYGLSPPSSLMKATFV